ncbi:MAG: FHA domain-containing protein [Bosea sp.]|uniref:FHA domain-containing protein n=1 Tax=Bosea sp. (in: a-proteobacteria) TaxID=1871050 RepID=UPI002399B8D6|nr:FHA domain-containing protein [Bosea sp. (in: a-proteobacteria)]MCP4733065.1 FHA domain-containing protein [Bosea sp. (in: a-proteobacteria)]
MDVKSANRLARRCEVCGFLNQPEAHFCAAPGCKGKVGHLKMQSFAPFGPGDVLPVVAQLSFPWGEQQVYDRLGIGRDPDFSTLSEALLNGTYANTVSRRHAELAIRDGRLELIDFAAGSNGTFVNRERLPKDVATVLKIGDKLSFGFRVEAKVVALRSARPRP